MPRQVSVKTSYRNDGAWLIRFEGAVIQDLSLPDDFRRDFAQLAHDLAALCLKADDIRNRREGVDPQEAGKKKKK